jgi:7,8-dihydropterin-6-yl-methyl-4-(beta-D-ribofuranosyl)aminobenzene 5'-phosphate synthase
VATGFRGKVYIHPAALSGKYQREKTPPHRSIGISPASERALRSRLGDVVESPRPTEIAPGLIVTGAIPRRNEYEYVPDPFFLDENCTKPGPLVDDQALLIETPRGWTRIYGQIGSRWRSCSNGWTRRARASRAAARRKSEKPS